MQEAASHFMIRVGVGLQKLFNHGQEVPVHRQDLFQVRKQHLWGEHMERLTYRLRDIVWIWKTNDALPKLRRKNVWK